MIVARLLMFLLFIFVAYKVVKFIEKQFLKENINSEIDKKKSIMEETIEASKKIDKDEIKAYKKAKNKIETLGGEDL